MSQIRRTSPVLLLLLVACREGEPRPFPTVPISPTVEATNGCNGPNQTFAGAPVPVTLSALTIGPSSQMVASGTAPVLYVTGIGATIYRLDFSGGVGMAPTEDVVVDAFPQPPGVMAPPDLSGVALLDPQMLIVADRTSNSLWCVDRFTPNQVEHYAGAIDEAGGFSDGSGSQAAFLFDRPAGLVSSADGTLFVADPGNHAVRLVFPGRIPEVVTVAGFTGMPGSMDGTVFESSFNAPTGLTISCLGELLVTEEAGGVLRSVELGSGGFGGIVRTLVSGLGGPTAPASSSLGEVYWVDSVVGNVRRFDLGSEALDTPLTGFMPGGGAFSAAVLQVGGTDHLFVLDADAGTLSRVTP